MRIRRPDSRQQGRSHRFVCPRGDLNSQTGEIAPNWGFHPWTGTAGLADRGKPQELPRSLAGVCRSGRMARYLLVRGPASQAGERRQSGMLGSGPCGGRGDQHREPAEHDGRRRSGKSPLAGPADPAACHMPEDDGWDGGDPRGQRPGNRAGRAAGQPIRGGAGVAGCQGSLPKGPSGRSAISAISSGK